MYPDPKQDFVFNDIPYTSKNILVKQSITNQCLRLSFQFCPGFLWIPFITHYIGAPVVYFIQLIMDQQHRARIKIHLAAGKFKAQARGSWLCFVDPVTTK